RFSIGTTSRPRRTSPTPWHGGRRTSRGFQGGRNEKRSKKRPRSPSRASKSTPAVAFLSSGAGFESLLSHQPSTRNRAQFPPSGANKSAKSFSRSAKL